MKEIIIYIDMRRFSVLLAAVSLVAFFPSCGSRNHSTSPDQTKEMKFSRLQAQFANPGKEYRAAPLWVWNTDVTTEDIDRTLTEMKEQGFGGAFVHPRPGLETEYLSDEWFRLWRYSVEKGKELGMDIWIYDENSYPSGFAGGHVPDQMPESYNEGQALVGRHSSTVPDSCFLCLKRDGDSFTDITSQLSEYKEQEGSYYVYDKGYRGATAWNAGFPYVDLLHQGVAEKFIEITMSGYEKEFGQELGTVVKGTFTDEPNIQTPCPGHCRWTPDLFDFFRQRWGYDLATSWPLLGERVANWKKVRHDYNATLLQMFIERWSKPWFAYTEKHHLYWTGHYWEHGWPSLTEGPDNMAMYAWHQLPAIDMLFNQFNDESPMAQFGNVRAVKELRSVANQKGYVRTLSETYGGGGWDESFQDFKRLGDWEYALGVNFMNQHLCHMTVTGSRKYDYPDVFTSIAPWWDQYHTQNDYFGRLSLVLSQGEQLNDILILEPTTTLWLYGTYSDEGNLMEIGQTFQSFITKLEKNQLEYDLGSEDIIKDCGLVLGKKFRVGERRYTTVVLPPAMENLESPTFELLKSFVQRGGRLVAYSRPTMLDGEENEELKTFWQNQADNLLFMNQPSELLALSAEESEFLVTDLCSNDLYHQRRIYDDGQLLFFANSSTEKDASANFTLPGKYLYRLDAMSGRIFQESEATDGTLTARLQLPPVGSALYFASIQKLENAESADMASFAVLNGTPLPPSSDISVSPVQPNILNLDFCNIDIDGTRCDAVYTVDAARILFDYFGMRNPWECSVQFKCNTLEADTITRGKTTVEYPFSVGSGVDMGDMKAIVERPDIWSVTINGNPVSSEGRSLLDARTGVFSIGQYVRQGQNTLCLHLPHMSMHAEVAPVFLQGHFSVQPATRGFSIQKSVDALTTSSWREQGYPFYGWDMMYSRRWNISDTSQGYYVQLDDWNGTMSQVFVNGQSAGIIASYPPYQLDVSPYLKKGENDICVRIVGSLRNVYGPHYSDLTGIMDPGGWNGVQCQAPGQDYHFSDYYLTGFSLCKK